MTRARIRTLELAAIAALVALAAWQRSSLARDERRAWLRSPQAAFLAHRRDQLLAAELGDCGCRG